MVFEDVRELMTQRVEGSLTYTQAFDSENRLVSVTASRIDRLWKYIYTMLNV